MTKEGFLSELEEYAIPMADLVMHFDAAQVMLLASEEGNFNSLRSRASEAFRIRHTDLYKKYKYSYAQVGGRVQAAAHSAVTMMFRFGSLAPEIMSAWLAEYKAKAKMKGEPA